MSFAMEVAIGKRLVTLLKAGAIDLHYALGQLGYEFEVTEGAELVESYDPEIPEGAVT